MLVRMRRADHAPRKVGSAVFIATLALTTLAMPDARGDESLPPPVPDDNPHTFCFASGVGGDAKDNIRAAEWNALAPTQARVVEASTCDLSGSTETDVVWHVKDLRGDRAGKVFCEDVDDTRCDQYYAYLDMSHIAIGYDDEIEETMTACHELGHTARLPHGRRKRDCMLNETGYDPPTALRYRRFSEHHIYLHINIIF